MTFTRAEHIGSLKRPDILLRRRAEFETGKCTAAQLRACEDASIANVVQLQLELGFQVITDGEYRRSIFYEGVFERISGLKAIKNPPEILFQSFNFVKSWPFTYICTSKLRRLGPIYGEAFDSLKNIAGPEHTAKLKLTIGAPEWYHFRHGEYTYEKTAYSNDAEYMGDVARIYREELADLYTRGCRRVQIDDPVLAMFCDEEKRRRMVEQHINPEELLETYVHLLNNSIRGRPADMEVGIHICRGNVKADGTSFACGGYDLIAEKLLTKLDVDCFYLEFDTPRAGGFAPLRHLPRDKRIVLGLVSTKTPVLEDPGALRERITQAAEVIARGVPPRTIEEALDQLAISPQCGFASHSRVTFVSYEHMVKKLELVRYVARTVWGNA